MALQAIIMVLLKTVMIFYVQAREVCAPLLLLQITVVMLQIMVMLLQTTVMVFSL
jgi:hypothetical protein